LHQGIREALRADFRGAQVGKRMAKLLVPGADVSEIIDEAERTLLDECDYQREAKSQRRFADVYASDDTIIVPAVHGEWSAARVLTTTWQAGKSFDEFVRDADDAAKNRAGAAIFRFYVSTFYAHAFFNADPHPGNMIFHDDGRVVFLDYGCVREFSPRSVQGMARLSMAVRDGDDDAVLAALTSLGARFGGKRIDEERAAAIELARAFFAPLLEHGQRTIRVGFSSAFQELLKHKKTLMKLHLPGELLFLVRIRFGAYSVLARLGASLDWRALESAAAARALAP
jgi:predicted unusual protein kinase regulating ubiquinone biosynthesis (AarF/ABC1/UbiB family)